MEAQDTTFDAAAEEAPVTKTKKQIPEPPTIEQLRAKVTSDRDKKVLEAIERYIKEPPENSRVFTISPRVADVLLAQYNQHNRPKKPTGIERYKREMREGTWGLTGDTIKFSDKALLRDGQNRFYACRSANVTFRTHIVFGIDDALFSRMDQGKNRNGSDLLAIEGVKNSGNIAAAIRWAHLFENGEVLKRTSYTPTQILELWQTVYGPEAPEGKNLNIEDFISPARSIAIKGGQHHPVGLIAGLLYHLTKHTPHGLGGAREFINAWEDSLSKRKSAKPFIAMRQRIEALNAHTSGRIHDVTLAALFVTCWNRWRLKLPTKATDYNWMAGDRNPFPAIER